LGVKLDDRPGFFAGLLLELQALRARLGRPHFIVVDEAHHVFPQSWDPGATLLPPDLAGFLFVTVTPDALSPRVQRCVDRLLVVGAEPSAVLDSFGRAGGLVAAPPCDKVPPSLPTGELLTLSRDDPTPRRMAIIVGKSVRRRHLRKYAEGRLGDDRSFVFRGPENRLNLRASNMIMFLEMAEGVDDETWEFHRRSGDYSIWIQRSIKDPELAQAVAAIERDEPPTAEAKARIRAAIEQRYTAPASGNAETQGVDNRSLH
jgi:hypothetical protein